LPRAKAAVRTLAFSITRARASGAGPSGVRLRGLQPPSGGLSPSAAWIIRTRAVDPYQLASENRIDGDRGVDSASQREEIRVDRTDDDSGMSRSFAMELHEVFSVQRQDSALIHEGGIEHIVVTYTLTRLSCLMDRQHVVAQCS
jgi:hypothetical protein